MEKKEPSYTVGENVNWCCRDGEQYGGSTKKLKIELPHDPEIPLLGIYPEKTSLKGYMQPNVHCGTVYNRKDTEAT